MTMHVTTDNHVINSDRAKVVDSKWRQQKNTRTWIIMDQETQVGIN